MESFFKAKGHMNVFLELKFSNFEKCFYIISIFYNLKQLEIIT